MPAPVLSRPPEPEMTPPRVSWVPVTLTALLPVMAIGAVTLLVPVLVAKVPLFKVIGSATPVTLRRSKVAPALTVVPAELAPNAAGSVMAKVPASTTVAPV